MKHVAIWADGACKGNPGPGGWGCILQSGEHEKELCGGEPHTTNNKMELRAVIEALRALKQPCKVTVTTDSNYVVKGMMEWMPGWKKKNFKDVKNVEIWKELIEIDAIHDVTYVWVRGHNGNVMNERADALANKGVPC